MARVTGKQRASRIPLDYYKGYDTISRWKLGLSALALVLSLGWWVSGLAFGGRYGVRNSRGGRMRYTHGPVARVHATWEAQCDACHIPLTPISGSASWAGVLGDPKKSDQKCQN